VPRNEDGEFELVLGNRQLMSVFFIVVILLGVFFAMGYIVGRGSNPVAGPDVATYRPESKPLVETPPPQREAPAPEAPKGTASQDGPAVSPSAQPSARPETVAPVPVKQSARVNTSAQPESGKTYLQLSAIDHDAAEIMVELLRKKSFSAITAEVPEKPGVFRVLVGPVAEADVAKIRTDLQNASFPGKEAIKRTF
jgi:cell division septation protein DedD